MYSRHVTYNTGSDKWLEKNIAGRRHFLFFFSFYIGGRGVGLFYPCCTDVPTGTAGLPARARGH